jgi:hypothetical protein
MDVPRQVAESGSSRPIFSVVFLLFCFVCLFLGQVHTAPSAWQSGLCETKRRVGRDKANPLDATPSPFGSFSFKIFPQMYPAK